jgi:hypothetical protein
MKSLQEIAENKRIILIKAGIDGDSAYVNYSGAKKNMIVVFSWGDGWDHVSVSYNNRCPTWDEMCYIKKLFFKPDEWTIQYNPSDQDNINLFPYCLHLWRPQNEKIPKPPKYMIA